MIRRLAAAAFCLAALAPASAGAASPRIDVVDAASGLHREVSRGEFDDVDWTPDGRRVIAARVPDYEDPHATITIESLAAGTPAQVLTRLPQTLDRIRIAPGGAAVAGLSYDDPTHTQAYLGSAVVQDLAGTVRASGFAQAPPDGAGTVAWSPDGRLVGVADLTARGTAFTAVDATTGAVVRTTAQGHGPATIDRGDWSPDGQHIAFRAPGQHTLSILDLATGAVRRLPDTPVDAVAWSPDGRRVIATRGRRLVTIDVTTGRQSTVVRRLHETPLQLIWRPGHQQLAVVSARRVLLLAAGGRVLRRLATVAPGEQVDPARWSADGTRLALVMLRL